MRPRILLLAACLALAAAALWRLQRSPWLSERLRAPLEQALTQAAGRPVRVGGVGGGLSGWIWLHQVEMGPAPGVRPLDLSASAQALGLQLNLPALLRGRRDAAALRSLRLEGARIFVLGRLSGQAGGDWKAGLQALPPLRLSLGGAQVWAQGSPAERPRLLAGELQAELDPGPAPGSRSLRASARSAGGKLHLQGLLGGADWSLLARGRDLELSQLAPAAGPGLQGRLQGELQLGPGAPAQPGALRLEGRGGLEGLALRSPAGALLLSRCAAAWSLREGRLKLDGLQADAWGGRLGGELEADLAARAFSTTLTARGADLGQLAAAAGLGEGSGLEGPAELELWLGGPWDRPGLRAGLSSRAGRWRGHPLRELGLRLEGERRSWRGGGKLDWEGGRGELKLAGGEGAGLRAGLSLRSFPADWLNAPGQAGLLGRLDGELSYGGPGRPWKLRASSPELKLGEAALRGFSLAAGGDPRRADFSLRAGLGSGPGLKLAAEARAQADGSWSLRGGRLALAGRSLAEAAGTWKPLPADGLGELGLDFKAGPVDLAWFKPPPGSPAWAGLAWAEGRLTRSAAAWSGELRVRAPGLSRGGLPLGAEAQLEFGPRGLSLSALELRKGEWRGRAWAPAPSGPWSAELRLKEAWLPALGALAPGFPRELSGRASGSLSFDLGAAQAEAALALDNPLPAWLPEARGSLNLKGRGLRWQLEKLELNQPGGGRLGGSLGLDLSGREAWKGRLEAAGLRLPGGPLDAALVLGGGAGRPGRLDFERLALRGRPLGSPQASFRFSLSGLLSAEGSWGRNLGWELRREKAAWVAQARLRGLDPGPLAGLFLGQPAGTELSLRGNLAAELDPRGLPLALRGDLQDEGSPGSRLAGSFQRQGASWRGQAEFHGLELQRLAAAGRELGLALPPLSGKTGGELRAEGSALRLSATARELGWEGRPLGAGRLLLGFSGGAASLEELSLRTPEGAALELGPGLWQRAAGGPRLEAELRASRIPLGAFRLSARGALRFDSSPGRAAWRLNCRELELGRRSWKDLLLEGSWEGGGFSLAERPGGRLRAQGSWREGALTLQGLQFGEGAASASLRGRRDSAGSLDFEGEWRALEAADLAAALGWSQAWTGRSWGSFKASGGSAGTRSLISLKVEGGSVAGLPFDLASGSLRLEGGRLELSPIQPLRFSRRGGALLELEGGLPLEKPAPGAPGMDVRVELKRGGLELLAGAPGLPSAEGPLELKLRFSGDPADPRVDGGLRVQGARLRTSLLPPLEQIELFAQLEDSRLNLRQARARVAGGGALLQLEQDRQGEAALVLERWLPRDLNLRLRANRSGIPLGPGDAQGFLSGSLHPDLRLGGSWEAPRLSGSLELSKGGGDKAVLEWPPRLSSAPGGSRGWLKRLAFDLRLLARSEVLLRSPAAQVFVDTGERGLKLEGRGEELGLRGRLKLLQGQVDLLLADFQLLPQRETWIDFGGTEGPRLELWAAKRLRGVQLPASGALRDLQVRLHAWGPLASPQVSLESDEAGLGQEQLAALAGLGPGESASPGGPARLLGKFSEGLLGRWARRRGWVDELGLRLPAVEQALGGGEAGALSPAARSLLQLSAGRYLGSKVYVGVDTQVLQRSQAGGRSSVDPAVGGKVEYRLRDSASLSVERKLQPDGQGEERVMLQGSAAFSNYSPRGRRWEEEAAAGPPTPSPSPSPGPR